jgi:hypothetical protein
MMKTTTWRTMKRRKSLKNRALIPRTGKAKQKTLSEMTNHFEEIGLATKKAEARARSQSRGRPLTRIPVRENSADAMDLDRTPAERARSARSKSRAPSTSRRDDGVVDVAARSTAERMHKLGQKKMNRMARQGEADRHVPTAMPKHLVSFLFNFPLDHSMLTITLVCWKTWSRKDTAQIIGVLARRLFLSITCYCIGQAFCTWYGYLYYMSDDSKSITMTSHDSISCVIYQPQRF